MAPKADQPPPIPTDLPGILDTLSSSDDIERLTGTLGSLFTLEASNLPKDQGSSQQLADKVLVFGKHSDASVRGAAIKAIARLLSLNTPLKECLAKENVSKDAWGILTDMYNTWPSYQTAVAQVMATGGFPKPDAAAAGNGKKPPAPAKGAVAAVDPESTLPGPSKQTLDAALRVLAVFVTAQPPAVDELTLAPPVPDALAWLDAPAQPAGLQPLVNLLSHHSPRVQYRAAQLVCLFARKKGGQLHAHLVAAGAAKQLVQVVATNGSGSVRLVAVQALQALTQTISAAHTQLLEEGAVAPLVLLASGSTACETDGTTVTPTGTMPPSTPPANSTRPGTPEKGGKLGATTETVTGQLDFTRPFPSKQMDLQEEALKLLITLSHFSQASTEQLVLQGGLQLLLSLLPGLNPPPAAPVAGTEAAAPAPAQPTQPTDSVPEESADAPLEETKPYQAWLDALSTPPPTFPPLPSHDTQVLALKLVTHALSIPGIPDALFDKLQAAAAAPETTTPQADPSAPPAPPPPRQPLEQLLSFFSGAPAAPATPLTLEPLAKGKADPKGKPPAKGKAEESAPPPPAAHTLPPFPANVRGAVLEALATLARHPPTAASLATHPEVRRIVLQLALPAAPPPSDVPTSSTPTPGAAPVSSSGGAVPSPAQVSSPAPDSDPEPASTPTAEPEVVHGMALLLDALTPYMARPAAEASEEHPEGEEITARITQAEVVDACKKIAFVAVQPRDNDDYLIKTAVTSLVLSLPENDFVAPSRPPLPSPPPTPPPLPLATSVFLWDALDRPMMADGKAKLEYM